jgi:bleomycin hydrolase
MTDVMGAREALGTSVDEEAIAALRRDFAADPAARVALNAVSRTSVDELALSREVVTATDFSFSVHLDDWPVTHQRSSGRCWFFAALNLFRAGAMKSMRLKDFEFSQNFTLFWDKFERANWFLEAMIDTASRPLDDRTVAFMLDRPIDDGGQWNMAVNIVRKHGVVPKAVMPETESSSATGRMNRTLRHRLRAGASELRRGQRGGADRAALEELKGGVLRDIWRILNIHLGTPPERFDWQWKDRDGAFHRDGDMTPLSFAERYIGLPIDDYVCLVHDPRESSPRGLSYTVDRLGNVVGGAPVVYLNVEVELMKELTRKQLEAGTPVWMGCDVGKQMHRELGLWDARLFEYEGLYGVELGLSKAERLDYHQTSMTHAMLFTGVDVAAGRTRRWRVENSWGAEKCGQKGFFTMNDSWFDDYMFEIAAPRAMLPESLREALAAPPVMLPAWDPMGSLAAG